MLMNTFWQVFCLVVGLGAAVVSPFVVMKTFGKSRERAEKFMYRLMVFVLVYKILHFTLMPTIFRQNAVKLIPVEISSVSYFLMPIAYLSGSKILKETGRFVGFFAGFVQLLAMSISPASFVNSDMTNFTFIESIVMHYSLYLGGLIWNFTIEPLRYKDLWKALTGFLVILLWGTLAAFTWRYDHVNNKPENIMFIQECVLPDFLLIPGFDKNHLFIIEYLAVFFVYIAILYKLSRLAFRRRNPEPRSPWGGGSYKRYLKEKNSLPLNFCGSKERADYYLPIIAVRDDGKVAEGATAGREGISESAQNNAY